ncbi:hypothetical protein N7448_003626 [Penicillium atrosanguineum]|uniref:UBL3-like ubiquitin domain-containing protein n=1 Tax=Penicillium atrosanguineum TaxID=1132637 RepID=A0A9W9U426_9EURO|nr:uncharacterized protein N7443_002596 [Penicillium atrosanguineum]KAJ5122492.1 hypothetical protein N7526_009429 [Penicillium atrosanguineum]KAJ5140218.1 hypothetical protein N7448_003626 [Penicillium atrosanguineum]KAJ5310135.1 hypothetical protein N7443_002596 [Penicillium atrosanguineum]KAJ5315651.1 hypothetical protein N7476_005958 [Penicillium atrosanguineum]
MSSTDNAESGVLEPKDHELGATSSPQTAQQTPSEPSNVPAKSGPVSDSIPSDNAQAADTANHPATGGESTAPVTATTSSTVTPPTDSNLVVAQTQNTDPPSMDTEEPKMGAELSEEQSDLEGKEVEDAGPSLAITLLLTTGARHPFTIDGKYLRKRSVNVENYDPFAMSVYTLKELIWREWRADWETRPSSPSSIRLISFGKLLDDKSPLADSKFNHDAPNVVHMTVKPQEVVDEEDAKGSKSQYSQGREASDRSPGCRCVIL